MISWNTGGGSGRPLADTCGGGSRGDKSTIPAGRGGVETRSLLYRSGR